MQNQIVYLLIAVVLAGSVFATDAVAAPLNTEGRVQRRQAMAQKCRTSAYRDCGE